MGEPQQDEQPAVSFVTATAWSATLFAANAVVGLFALPSLKLIWIVLLVFAIAAGPQVLLRARSETRKRCQL